MKPIFIFLFVITTLWGCQQNRTGINSPIVIDYIDSLCRICEPIRNNQYERVKIDGFYLNEKRKQWQYADTISKYCSTEELVELAKTHDSSAIRYITFQLLLMRDSHEAVKILINDIDSDDSICATRLDEGFPELLSGLRVGLVQNHRELYDISVEDSIAVDCAVSKSKNKDYIKRYKGKYYGQVLSPQQ